MRNNYSNYLGVVTSAGASDEHPLSIHSASIRRRWHSRGMQVICTLVLLFTFAIGQMWGADYSVVADWRTEGTSALTPAIGATTDVVTISPISKGNALSSVTVTSGTKSLVGIYINTNYGGSNKGGDFIDIRVPAGYTIKSIDSMYISHSSSFSSKKGVYMTYAASQLLALDAKSASPGSEIQYDIPNVASNATYTTVFNGGFTPTAPAGKTADSIRCVRIYKKSSSGQSHYIQRIKVTVSTVGASCSEPAAPTISGTTSYTESEDISLTASATGTDGSTTYTWYKGADWATASAGSSIGSAATYTKNSCVEGDAGTYWCNISNGTGCEVQVSKTITVAAAQVANPTITGVVSPEGYGSISPASITVTSGDAVTINGAVLTCGGNTLTATPADATAEYTYSFVEWTCTTPVTANVNATATFSRTANSYTLAWDKNAEDADDLAGDYTSGTVAYGSDITKPNTPTRDGYDFLGWAETSSGDVVTVPATMPAADKTYYAKWAADPCSEPAKVTNEIARFFVPCGLSNLKGEGSDWTETDEDASTGDNTFSTYKFGGSNKNENWYRNPTTGLIYGKLTKDDGYISLKLNSGNFKAGDVVTAYVKTGNNLKLNSGASNAFGAASASDVTGEYQCSITLAADNIESDGSIKIKRNGTIYVNRIIVTREPAPKHHVTYALNGATGTTPTQDDVEEGESFTLHNGTTGITAPAGKAFASWSDGTTTYAGGAEYTMGTSDITLTAQWEDKYTVTLIPAGGSCASYDGWTYDNVNDKYTKEVGSGAEVTLPTFTKANRTFKTWRNAVPADVPSPITVTADVTLTAVWNATVENVIYSWEGAEGGATEVGGTAAGSESGLVNTLSEGYYCLRMNGDESYSKYVEITLSGEEKIKTGDKITYLGFYSNASDKNASPKMRDSNGSKAEIFADPDNLPKINGGVGTPAQRTFTVPEGINTNKVQMTRSKTGSSTYMPKLQIVREVQVEEANLRTVTFNYNDGGVTESTTVEVASGSKVAAPADPTWAHHRFNEWQLSGSAYDFSTAVTASITLDAIWTQLYAVTYDANGGEGTMTDANEYAAGDKVTLKDNTFTPPTDKAFDKWVVTKTASGDEISVSNNKFTMPAEAVTVTATWKYLPKLTLTAGEGATGDDVVSYHAAGTEISVPAKPEGFSKGTDEFTGWAYSTSVSVEAGKFNMPSSDLTLTAQWASAAAVAQIVGGDSYGTFADAIAAVDDGQTIKLLDDCSFDDKWTITGKTVTLDMNGNNLAGPAGGDGVEVGDGGKLILTDGSVMVDPAIDEYNVITYAGGKLTGKWPINVVAGGEFEMNGGWIVGGEAAVWVGYTGKVTINNGVLEAMDNAVVMAPGNAGKGGYTINVHGGILLGHIQTAGYASMVIYHPNVGTLNIDGGKLISTNGPAVVIRGGDSNITGGEIVAQGTGTGKCGDASQLLGAVGIAADFKSAYPGVANTDVAISGTINVIAAADEAVQAIYADATPTSAEVAAVAVSGGTFNRELTQEVCAENYAPEDNGDGTYGVKPLAVTFDIEAYVVSTAEPTLQQVKDSLTAVGYTYSNIAAVDRGHTHNNIYDGIKWSNSNDGYIQFETAAGKLVIVKTGYMKSNTAAKMSVNGVEDATVIESADETKETHKLYYWYNAGATLYKLDIKSKTAGGTCVLKAITITDPYQVSFNTHGGDPVAPQTFYGTALTLPGATNGTQIFKGWYDADTEGNLIGKAGDSYTPTASITLHAQWETVSSDNTLSALEVDNVALADFDPDKHIYNIVCEYGHTPQITLATATAEAQGATVTIVNTPVDGDGYKYIQANVIPASGTPIGYNQVRYTNLPKKGVSLIKVTIPNGTGNTQTIEEANITGYIGGTATQKLESGKHKLGSGGHFIGMTLAEGTFQENDLVIVNVEEIKTDLMRVFKENTAAEDNVVASSTANMTVGDNYVTLGATTTNSLYLRRGTNDENYQTGWNPFIGSFEVQRYMDPFIEEFKIGEAVGTISKDEYENNIISVEVPYSTDITSLTPTIKAWANGGATLDKTGAQDFSSAVVYKVSSAYAEDGEVAYTVNVTKAEASHAATLSDIKLDGVSLEGFDPATLSYDVELEKGTTEYPTVTYTAATGATVVPNSATFPGAYNLVVTAEDGETTQTYTINFTVSTKIKVVIFDGTVAAQADALKASPDGTTGASWSLEDLSVSSSSFTGYNYQIATGGSTGTSKHIAVTVPANYLPQFVITQVTNSNNTARNALVGTSTTRPASTADALFYVTNSDQANPSTGTSDQLNEETTYYIHSDASINFLKIALLLEPILPKCEAPALSGLADMNVCALGDALSVTATTTDGGSFAYQWYKEAGETDTEVGTDSNEFIPGEEGQYYVVVTHSKDDHRDNATTSDVVTVSLKTATAITTAPANQRGAVGAQVTLSVTAAGEGLSYAWYTCDNEAGENPVALDPAVTAASLQVTITENMNQWYKVVVSGDCGAESATALVEEWTEVEQADVTGSMIWDWTKSCWDEHSNVQLPDDKINVDTLMANTGTSIVNNSEFRSDMLVIRGQYAWRNEGGKKYFQGFGVKFHATVPGMVKVTYRGTGNSKNVILSIGDYTAPEYAGDYTTVQAVVPAGDVVITGIGGTGNANGMVRINKIEFDANLSSYEFSANPFGGYERANVTPGVYGTICLPNGGVMTGASIFEVAYMTYENNNPYKVFFDEVLNGTMVAGRPYIFIPNEDVTAIRVYYTDAANASAGDYRGLHGTFDHMNGDDLYGKYIFYNNMIFESKNSQNWLDENRAYIVLSDVPDYITPVNPSSRRIALGVNGTNTATGFENAAADEAPVKMMIDGKLFILRGEKMYDATGKLVK